MEYTLNNFCEIGKQVITTEMDAIRELAARLDQNFADACQLLLNCKGRIIVIGMGKSGHVGNKMAATLASTGSPAFFVHPAEAFHGDLGMITRDDIILAISYSGQTEEVIKLLPAIKRLGVKIISISGNPNSELSSAADVNLNIHIEIEACPLGLAPTSSTTATLVMGDALAVALLKAKGFTREDFALTHPGGNLGKKLLLRVSDIMHKNDDLPLVSADTLIKDAILTISKKQLGLCIVTDKNKVLLGIFTDGDLRRTLNNDININQAQITEVFSSHPKTCHVDALAAEALSIMEENSISSVVVTDENQMAIGLITVRDLLKAGVI